MILFACKFKKKKARLQKVSANGRILSTKKDLKIDTYRQ